MNLEFFIKMREMVSSGLIKMASTAKKTTDNIVTGNKYMTQSYDTIRRKISELESAIGKSTSIKFIREAKRELNSLNRLASVSPGNISRGVGGFFAGMFRQLLPALGIAGGLALGGGVLGAGVAQERNITSLRTFIGSDAERAYGNIVTDAARTTFGIESLLDVNRALITTGISADRARQDTLNLANAIAATGGSNPELMRMAVNMQQIANAGKATALDIRQFAYAGINIYGILQAATGKTKEELKDMDVTYDMLAFALNKAAKEGGLYARAMEAQMKTVGGRYTMMKDTIRIGAAEIGTSLQPFMHSLIDIGNTMINFIVPASISFINAMKENWRWVSLVITILGSALIAYNAVIWATKAWTAAQAILNGTMMLNPVGLVIAAIAALVGVVIWAWNNFEGFRGTIWGVWEVLKVLAVYIKQFLQPGIQFIIWQFQLFKLLVKTLWDVFKDVFTRIGNFFEEKFGPIIAAIKWIWNTTATAIGNSSFGKKVADAWTRGMKSGEDTSTTATTPASANLKDFYSGFTPTGMGADGDSAARGIAGGGPRIINIHINKMVEKIEVHANTLDEGLKNIEDKIEEHFLRLLNSGASVQ